MHNRISALTLLLVVALLQGCAASIDPDRRFANQHRMQLASPDTVRPPAPAPEGSHYIFTSFKVLRDTPSNFGFHLLYSNDGLNWTPLNDDQPIFFPQVGRAQGMRDPAIAQGPDGTFHMVWTWERGSPQGIGYASSRDLVEWTNIRDLKVMKDTPNDYCWAPQLFYDHDNEHWLVVWSTEVKGRFEETARTAVHNHRLYYTTTTDFETLAPTQLYFDPGYAVIDPAFIRLSEADARTWHQARKQDLLRTAPHRRHAIEARGTPPLPRYVMFFKDERSKPAKKQLRMATSQSLYGPWENITRALTRTDIEGPTVLRLGDEWIVYFDEFRTQRYGAMRSYDLVHWDDISAFVNFPRSHRHGAVLEISPEVARRLLDQLGPGGRQH